MTYLSSYSAWNIHLTGMGSLNYHSLTSPNQGELCLAEIPVIFFNTFLPGRRHRSFMPTQLRYGDTCQIWTRYSTANVHFGEFEKLGKSRNGLLSSTKPSQLTFELPRSFARSGSIFWTALPQVNQRLHKFVDSFNILSEHVYFSSRYCAVSISAGHHVGYIRIPYTYVTST